MRAAVELPGGLLPHVIEFMRQRYSLNREQIPSEIERPNLLPIVVAGQRLRINHYPHAKNTMKDPRFHLQCEKVPRPKPYLEQLRRSLRELGPSPACLRFTGCGRLLYKAAKQMNVQITVRRQSDGSYRVWKLSPPAISATLKRNDEDEVPENTTAPAVVRRVLAPNTGAPGSAEW